MSGTIFFRFLASAVASEAIRDHLLPAGRFFPPRPLSLSKSSGPDRVNIDFHWYLVDCDIIIDIIYISDIIETNDNLDNIDIMDTIDTIETSVGENQNLVIFCHISTIYISNES